MDQPGTTKRYAKAMGDYIDAIDAGFAHLIIGIATWNDLEHIKTQIVLFGLPILDSIILKDETSTNNTDILCAIKLPPCFMIDLIMHLNIHCNLNQITAYYPKL